MSKEQPLNSKNPLPQSPGLPEPARWVDLYGDSLFRYAVFRLRKREAAEDVVQETFLAALEARTRFRNRSSVKTWLIGILKRKIADHLRRERQMSPPDASAAADMLDYFFDHRGKWRLSPGRWGGDPSDHLERDEFWQVFRRCLGKLPPMAANAFVLRQLEGASSAEVRRSLSVSAANLWVLLHRARLRLLHCLDLNWFSS